MEHPPAGWYADPLGRFEHRYWDGVQWTDHAASNGRQWTDPPSRSEPSTPRTSSPTAERVREQVRRSGHTRQDGSADTTIFNEPVLVINQRGKLVELRAEYSVYDQTGRQIAAVRGKRLSSRMQVVDLRGQTLLDLRREMSLVGPKMIVTDSRGRRLGRLATSISWNKVDRDFKLEGSDNEVIGAIYREDGYRHREFNVQDADGNLVASISKTHAGIAKELFTKADNYVVSISAELSDGLRSLTIAAALFIDSTYHQH